MQKYLITVVYLSFGLLLLGCKKPSSSEIDRSSANQSEATIQAFPIPSSELEVVTPAPTQILDANKPNSTEALTQSESLEPDHRLLSSGIEEEPPPNEDGQVTEKEQGYAEDQVYFVEDSFPDFSDLGYSRDEIPLPQESNPQSSSCDSDALVQKIPPRNENALSGTDFVNKIRQDSGTQRDELIVTEILNGNVPNHLRKLYPVEFSHGETSIQICVSGDYLAVGSDDDFVRFPLGLPATYRLFEHLDFILPTTAMVDQIYHDADHKLAPSPKKPGLEMETTSYIFEHNEAINSQVDANVGLIAGHKKDVVLSNRLLAKPQSIAIYGWHRPNGKVIQPLSTVHHKNYADYSHGIRLISNTAFLNGKAVHLRDLLQDSLYAELINPNEGPTSF